MSDIDEEETEKKVLLPPMSIRYCDLPAELLHQAQVYAHEAMEAHKLEKDIATAIKKRCDEDLAFNTGGKGAWQCIVGKSFGMSITYDAKWIAFFDVIPAEKTVLLFRSQR
ncbi:unnamed protein product [Vitrella brassicaformis CCMP3155]|uniref:Dynein light chain n=2 Tax=Vitrella brassicaformis TaxID=1169539 RepID=A0A0G4ECK0_VITBC|nr:unnamed protein product [Vitrella brassicaformis CCMP3155]|mmetsp:Transcript_21746/g.53280  ORF Transcript_21746/g.53280 Transcript_21746/m.53280 type:complete len:111 (+) Transcript_21746:104-436(+)|eukprot:CEL93031.1 unnamed protein product [Vitrella brassicaformis CCMP3155]